MWLVFVFSKWLTVWDDWDVLSVKPQKYQRIDKNGEEGKIDKNGEEGKRVAFEGNGRESMLAARVKVWAGKEGGPFISW